MHHHLNIATFFATFLWYVISPPSVDNGKLHVKDGRVLVKYKGVEGSVCFTEDWNIHSANVVCQQLGLRPYALSTFRIPFFDFGNDLFHFDSDRCEGYENMLVDCGMSLSACETKHYAGVSCLDGGESGRLYVSCTLTEIVFTVTRERTNLQFSAERIK